MLAFDVHKCANPDSLIIPHHRGDMIANNVQCLEHNNNLAVYYIVVVEVSAAKSFLYG